MENLLAAWREFSRGKNKKLDVLEFKYNLEDNLFGLHSELKDKTYRHSHYTAFNVYDPKLRRIHKACVRDRVLHHAVFRVLYPIFDKSFIFDSYSCRLDRGTHRAVNRLEKFCRQTSQNNTRNIFALKCDVRKFFDSIDHDILIGLIKNKITDEKALRLISDIIGSFTSSYPLLEKERGNANAGLPLGNVTSQLFANIYLNEFDQFIKHKLKIRHYLRYCDDFAILGLSPEYLNDLIAPIGDFLESKLKLSLHPDKIIIRKYHQGIDWLGYIILPRYRALRTKTKIRMLKKIERRQRDLNQGLVSAISFGRCLQSYFGVLKHCQGHKIRQSVIRDVRHSKIQNT